MQTGIRLENFKKRNCSLVLAAEWRMLLKWIYTYRMEGGIKRMRKNGRGSSKPSQGHWWMLVDTVLNLRFQLNAGNSLTKWGRIRFSELCTMELFMC